MYCPNCGENEELEVAQDCSNCSMPLRPVAELVQKFRAESPEYQKYQREQRAATRRLIGAATFLTIAAVPIGLGVKNGLQQSKKV